MGYAEFEEKEFERPLYNQLEVGTSYVWSPGQCFEKFIGIDHSLYVLHDLSSRFGLSKMPSGVILKNYDLGYIWRMMMGRRRDLPDFSLNMFIQAKRPYEYKKGLSKLGFNKRCFKFITYTPQQKMLEKLDIKLGGNALVVYAAPVFSTLRELYKHTANKTMIENTTFPSVSDLIGHQSWIYDCINYGVGCSEPEEKNIISITERINSFVDANRDRMPDKRIADEESLLRLIRLIEESLYGINDVQASEYFNRKEEVHKQFRMYETYENRFQFENLIAYILVNEFCGIYNLDWFVLG